MEAAIAIGFLIIEATLIVGVVILAPPTELLTRPIGRLTPGMDPIVMDVCEGGINWPIEKLGWWGPGNKGFDPGPLVDVGGLKVGGVRAQSAGWYRGLRPPKLPAKLIHLQKQKKYLSDIMINICNHKSHDIYTWSIPMLFYLFF